MKKILNSFDINFNFKDYTFREIKELRKMINDIDLWLYKIKIIDMPYNYWAKRWFLIKLSTEVGNGILSIVVPKKEETSNKKRIEIK